MRKGAPTLFLLALTAFGCKEATNTENAAGEAVAPFEIRPVREARIAELEAAIGAPENSASAESAGDTTDQVQELLRMFANSDETFREIALDDLKKLGASAVPTLASTLAQTGRESGERIAAITGLAAIDTPAAADALMGQVTNAQETWVRSHCAWHLGSTTQDHIVPPLTLRLKYETDHETVVWIARTLGQFGNFSGLKGLFGIRDNGPTPAVRQQAQTVLSELAEGAGFASEVELWDAWHALDPEAQPKTPEPSDRHLLALWREVSDLSGEHFQLRGVDDARIILSNGAGFVAGLLAEALHDEDVYVRVHVAQCLERMGARASASAGPTLLAALGDPGVAADAAAALGAIGFPEAVPVLIERAKSPKSSFELRVAAVRALGNLGLAEAVPVLQERLNAAADPLDLRQSAAQALVTCGQYDEAVPFLLGILKQSLPGGDVGGAEQSLQRWLERESAGGDVLAKELLRGWKEHAGPPAQIPTPADVAARRAARVELLEARRADWAG